MGETSSAVMSENLDASCPIYGQTVLFQVDWENEIIFVLEMYAINSSKIEGVTYLT